MRRAILAGVSTICGLVMLLSFKTHSQPTDLAAPPAAFAGPSPTTTAPPAPLPGSGAGSSTTTTTTPPAAGTKTVVGDPVQTRYGPVEVQITVTDGRVTAADAIVYPTVRARDRDINSRAIPALDQEATAAQNANIHMISGATYTSAGYIRSLQSALDKAGLA